MMLVNMQESLHEMFLYENSYYILLRNICSILMMHIIYKSFGAFQEYWIMFLFFMMLQNIQLNIS